MPDIDKKTEAYNHICKVYDEYLASLDTACRPGCATCCTINVTMTSLEGYLIVDRLERTGRMNVLDGLDQHVSGPRFVPQFTFNRLTEMMLNQEPVPEEIIDPAWGRCPFTDKDQCPIYEVRPFACRCLVSQEQCRPGEAALMSPLTLAVNHIMLQYIEHVDAGGVTGNLIDVLIYMRSTENRRRYLDGRVSADPHRFVPNLPVRRLVVEPEYKDVVTSLLAALNRGGA